MQEQPIRLEMVPGRRKGENIVRMEGPLMLGNLLDFQQKVRSDSSASLILDMSKVPFIDSAGIGALVGVQVSRRKDGRRLAVVGANDNVRKSLRMTNVEQFFYFYETQEEAEATS